METIFRTQLAAVTLLHSLGTPAIASWLSWLGVVETYIQTTGENHIDMMVEIHTLASDARDLYAHHSQDLHTNVEPDLRGFT